MRNKYHNWIAKQILGKSFADLNRSIDLPWKIYGKNHRQFFHNDSDILLALACNEKIGTALALHVLVDRNPDMQDLLKMIYLIDKKK